MKILLIGKSGQVGWELRRSLVTLGNLTVVGSQDSDPCGDLRNLEGVRRTVRALSPDIIVNAAAYTAVDLAESDPETARTVNATAVCMLAEEALRSKILLIHFSTDYVFNGSGDQPWTESDSPEPLNIYGKTKWEGEQAVRESGCRHMIFRTSWVYGSHGKNFVRTILRAAVQKEELRVVADQIGSPTSAELIADVTLLALREARYGSIPNGVYHLVAGGQTSWYEYAVAVVDFAKNIGVPLRVKKIEPVPSLAYPTPAVRPLNSRLDTTKLRSALNIVFPDWKIGVVRMLEEVLSEKTL